MDDPYRAWIGKKRTARDLVTASPVARLAATLDRDDPAAKIGDELPPVWHWLYFLEAVPMRGVGPDGHAARGEFLPPVPLPRRMYAGGRFEFRAPIRIGETISRTSEIVDVALKQGRTGALAFCTVRHTIANGAGPCVVEHHDIVYRGAPVPGEAPAPAQPPPAGAEFGRTIAPDPVLLFRFSALTFNGHRIHYDHPYVTKIEGYPGLIVHGPLLAILLLDLVRRERPRARMSAFSFRAFRPVFDTGPFRIAGKGTGDGLLLWAEDNGGALAMRAEAKIA
ncbi:MAG TPA: MaoC family dehydratase N-terminal domain-containing protein [Alphaproteobacteria bacterium]|jgi:3-methylfumaryl-CoA hydratase